jgi:hypothetical protein
MAAPLTPARLATTFHTSLAARLETFLLTQREAVEGFWADALFQAPIQVHFSGPEYARLVRARAAEPFEGWVPLATLGREEACFLAVQTSRPECPVAMWEPDTNTYTPYADSLEAFLAALGATAKLAKRPKADNSALEAVQALLNEGDALLEGRLTKAKQAGMSAVLEQLKGSLPLLPPAAGLKGGRFARLHVSAIWVKAKLLAALKRYGEACDTLEGATVDGVQRIESPVALCRWAIEELDQPERVDRVCRGLGDDLQPLLRISWALALLRLDDLPRATEQLTLALAQQVAATVKLKPKTVAAEERTRRLGLLHAEVTAYAQRHHLEAKATQALAALK